MNRHAGVDHQPPGRDRIGGRQQLQDLDPDPFAGEPGDLRRHRGAGLQRRAIRRRAADLGVEAEIAQQPQIVLLDAPDRVADEADPAGAGILRAAEIVRQPAVLVGGRFAGQGGQVGPEDQLPRTQRHAAFVIHRAVIARKLLLDREFGVAQGVEADEAGVGALLVLGGQDGEGLFLEQRP